MSLSSFSSIGLNLGNGDSNLSYIYGMSDFWAFMFEDSEKINLLLEATSHQCSDVYSKFLQLTSTLSLADIQTTIGYQTKLILLTDQDAVPGKVNTFYLSEKILDCRYISNRPFLPTSTLEKGVHFELSEDGTEVIIYSDISKVGFPSRALASGSKQYALWFADAKVDEQLISTYYANLINISPEVSTEAFKNFVYGLYYLYINGPDLDKVRKGLNLALGIPLARGAETVLDIRKYLDTDQWLVTTDNNSYLIPYGLEPTVSVGEELSLAQELAFWIEVKDYINDGEWWINLQIPPTLIPFLPDGKDNKYAAKGSYADYIMRTYLSKHTFLVNVKVTDFKNIQYFEELSSIIKQVKPTNTTPIYIWSVPINNEVLNLIDSDIVQRRNKHLCENITVPIERFFRNSPLPIARGCSNFLRYNVPHVVEELAGFSSPILNNPMPFDGASVRGFIDANKQIRSETDTEKGWLNVTFNRFSEIRINRDKVSFARNVTRSDNSGVGISPFSQATYIDQNLRCVPLYVTTKAELQSRLDVINFSIPDKHMFAIFKPELRDGPINAAVINESYLVDSFNLLVSNFNTLFFKSEYAYLGHFMPAPGYVTYAPQVTDLKRSDYLLVIKIYDSTYGVYWVTSNDSDLIHNHLVSESSDQMSISVTAGMSRGMGATTSPAYMLRGANSTLNYISTGDSINSTEINYSEGTADSEPVVSYSDAFNTNVPLTRGGASLVIRKELL